MENIKNKNAFLITCIASIMLLLLLCYLGINSSSTLKGTSASSMTYYSIGTCASAASNYESTVKSCENGVASGSKCCPTADFTYSASGHCLKYYDDDAADFDNEAAKADCASFSGYTYYNTGAIAQCSGAPLGNSEYQCINNAVRNSYGYCCPSGYEYEHASGYNYCVKPGYNIVYDEAGLYGLGAGYVCYTYSSSASSSSSSSSASSSSSSASGAGCYCMDTEDGTPTCKRFTTNPGGGYTLSPDSNCESGSSSSSSSVEESGCFKCGPDTGYVYTWMPISIGNTSCTPASSFKTQSTCEAANEEHACFKCGPDTGYVYTWMPISIGNTSCTPASSYSKKDDCEAANDSSTDGFNIVFNAGTGATISPGGGITASDTCTPASGSTTCKVTTVYTATMDGKVFKGWGSSCAASNAIDFSGDAVVNACWEDDVKKYTVSYEANGGTGSMADTTCTEGQSCATTRNQFTKSCNTFNGWTGSDGKSYSNGASVTLSDNLTLTAKWYYSCGGSGGDPDPEPSSSSSTPSEEPSSSEYYEEPSEESSVPDVPSSSSNTDYNPQTGQITIFIVWVVAFAAIVYSVWYFKKVRES